MDCWTTPPLISDGGDGAVRVKLYGWCYCPAITNGLVMHRPGCPMFQPPPRSVTCPDCGRRIPA
jgi:hypothetical protein